MIDLIEPKQYSSIEVKNKGAYYLPLLQITNATKTYSYFFRVFVFPAFSEVSGVMTAKFDPLVKVFHGHVGETWTTLNPFCW